MTEPKTGTMSVWYFIDKDGRLSNVTYGRMMEPRFGVRIECYSGERYVRGPHMITEARNMGWHDLADRLEAAGFVDVNN